MRVLKAYQNIGSMGQQPRGSLDSRATETRRAPVKSQVSRSGDCLSLSAEARELLAGGGANVSVLPQDATYDRQGNVMRQFENLQSELRALGSKFIGSPENAAIAGGLGAMRAQLAGLRAQV